METLVVYESMWGNTAQVAGAIARGLGGAPVTEVTAMSTAQLACLDLLVLGGPTHAFSMSRETTRHDAHQQGASRGSGRAGIREQIAELPTEVALTLVLLVLNVCVGVVLLSQGTSPLLDGVPLTPGEIVGRSLSFLGLTVVAGGLLGRMFVRSHALARAR